MDGSLKIKAILIDLSGTIHIDDEPTPNAIQALNKLVSCFVLVFYSPHTKNKHIST